MLIRKSIHFTPEYRCNDKLKNGEKEIIRKNLPLRMRVSYNNLRIEFVTGIRVDADKYAYGIAGIAEIFHCSLPTVNRIKKSGRIKKAITQIGRKIIVDKKLALELAGQPVYRRKSA